MKENCFTRFKAPIEHYELPERFTFPFYYEPHPLAILAAEELQQHLKTQTQYDHNFGIDPEQEGMVIGKMFGVLVVQNQVGEIGYLSAFSGKLANENHHEKFVPPVFDTLVKGDFLNVGLIEVNHLNQQIDQLEQAPDYLACQQKITSENTEATQAILEAKAAMKIGKVDRAIRRNAAKTILSSAEYSALEHQLSQESQLSKIRLKHLIDDWKIRLANQQLALQGYVQAIDALKEKRKTQSAALQQKIFHQYRFLNQQGTFKDLVEIFTDSIPIAGSGECAAPKLLQFAFLHQLKPIAMAEFWWGASPKSEIRQHANFYPACIGKCKPILTHMLEGIELDENPMLINTAAGKKLEIVYEDEVMLIINKPAEFLSVPGKNVQDSVAYRLRDQYPDDPELTVVHRLDMSTSGLLLVAKTKKAYKYLQYQFIKRKIKKCYVALIDGIVTTEEGCIELPLRGDLADRPRQLVCYDYGKKATTKWKVIKYDKGKTRLHFFPISGRTHQLRVHAAHVLGLNMPIVGDDLYGKKADRLYLHAAAIEFRHPISKELMKVEVEADF